MKVDQNQIQEGFHLSITHSIGKLIAIQDANIVFNEEFFHMGTLKGKKASARNEVTNLRIVRRVELKVKTIRFIKMAHKLRGFPCFL